LQKADLWKTVARDSKSLESVRKAKRHTLTCACNLRYCMM